jgi:hypothetical protein
MWLNAEKKWEKRRLSGIRGFSSFPYEYEEKNTDYSFVVLAIVTLGVEPFKKECSGWIPPPSSQSIPTGWLFRFVESIEPLNQGCRSTLRPL